MTSFAKHAGHRISTILMMSAFLFLSASLGQAAIITWTNGNGTGIWSDGLNWSSGTVPGTSDVATFNGTSTANCSVNTTVNVQGIDIQSGYTGTITQQAVTMTIGTSDWNQADGTFAGSASNIDNNDYFTLSGGTFTSTSGIWYQAGYMTVSGGTFNHNNGTFQFDGAGKTLDVLANTTFYNVNLNQSGNQDLYVTSGDTLRIGNKLTCNNGGLRYSVTEGYLHVYGDVEVNSGYDPENIALHVKGPANSTLDFKKHGQTFTNIYIEKYHVATATIDCSNNSYAQPGISTDNLHINTGTLAFNSSLSYINMDFANINHNGGTLLMHATNTMIYGNYTHTGGTLNHNSALVTFDGPTKTLNLLPADQFYNVTLNQSGNNDLYITGGDYLHVMNKLTCDNGGIRWTGTEGFLHCHRDVEVNSGYDPENIALHMVGTAAGILDLKKHGQTFTNIYIEKTNPTNTVTIDCSNNSYAQPGTTSDDLHINSGTLDFDGTLSYIDLDFSDINLNGGTLSNHTTSMLISGNFTHTGGTMNHNNSTVTFDGNSKTVDLLAGDQFYNVILQQGGNQDLYIPAGDILEVRGKLTCNDGGLRYSAGEGFLHCYGDVEVNSGYDTENVDLHMVGTANAILDLKKHAQTFTDIYIEKDNTSNTVTIDCSNNSYAQPGSTADQLHITSGTLDFDGTLSYIDMDFSDINHTGGVLSLHTTDTRIYGNYTHTGGTLQHNSALVTFDGATKTLNLLPTDQFYNVLLQQFGQNDLYITGGDILQVMNKLTCNDGGIRWTGTEGFLHCYRDVEVNSGYDTENVDLYMVGSDNAILDLKKHAQTFTDIYINKTADANTVTIDCSNNSYAQPGFTTDNLHINSGTLQFDSDLSYIDMDFDNINHNGGILSLHATDTRIYGNYTHTGGTIQHNSALITFDQATKTVNLLPNDQFFNVLLQQWGQNDLYIASGDTLHVMNKLTCNDGGLRWTGSEGYLYCYGDVEVNSGYDTENVDLHMAGNSNAILDLKKHAQTFTDIYIEKDNTANTVTIDCSNNSYAQPGSTSDNLHLMEGTLDFDATLSYIDLDFANVNITGGSWVSHATSTLLSGNLDNTGGTISHNNGSWTFDAGAKTLNLMPADTFYNVNFNNNGSTNVTITSGDTLVVENTLTYNNGRVQTGDVHAYGNVTVNSGFDGGSSDLLFKGNANQTFNSPTSTVFEADIELDKSLATAEVTLQSALYMDDIGFTLTLTKGLLTTTTTNLLQIADNVAMSGGSDSSYVNGPIRKNGNDAFTYHVGKGGVYQPVSLTAPSSTSHAFRVEHFRPSPDLAGYDTSLHDVTVDHVSDCEYWLIDQVSGSPTAQVTLPWDDEKSCGVDDPSALTIVRWNGSQWVEHVSTVSGSLPSGTIQTNAAVTSFSPFTLASLNSSNPLPVELLGFEAHSSDLVPGVDLTWATATEINSDHFVIERSLDGVHFEAIGTEPAAGNSSVQLAYSSHDPLNNVSLSEGLNLFYRLKQVDQDGSFEYSEVRTVQIQGSTDLLVYPNPFQGTFTVQFGADYDGGAMTIQLFSMDGRTVYSQNIVGSGPSLEINPELSKGQYILAISYGNSVVTKRVSVVD